MARGPPWAACLALALAGAAGPARAAPGAAQGAPACAGIRMLDQVDLEDCASWPPRCGRLLRPGPLVFAAAVLLCAGLLLAACRRDLRHGRDGLWADGALLTDNPAYRRLGVADQLIEAIEGVKVSGCFTEQCSYLALARALRIDAGALRLIWRGAGPERQRGGGAALAGSWAGAPGNGGGAPGGSEAARPGGADSKLAALAERVRSAAPGAVEAFWRRGPLGRCCHLFWAQHPLWTVTLFLDLRLRCASRALALVARVMGSLALNACFFVYFEGGTSRTSDPGCEAESTRERVLRHVAVGVLTSFVAAVPTRLAAFFLVRRRFLYRERWDEGNRRRMLRSWRCADLAHSCILASYSLCAIFFTAVFLSHASEATGTEWSVSCSFALLKDTFLLPLAACLLLCTGSKVHSLADPQAALRARRPFEGAQQKLRDAGTPAGGAAEEKAKALQPRSAECPPGASRAGRELGGGGAARWPGTAPPAAAAAAAAPAAEARGPPRGGRARPVAEAWGEGAPPAAGGPDRVLPFRMEAWGDGAPLGAGCALPRSARPQEAPARRSAGPLPRGEEARGEDPLRAAARSAPRPREAPRGEGAPRAAAAPARRAGGAAARAAPAMSAEAEGGAALACEAAPAAAAGRLGPMGAAPAARPAGAAWAARA